MAMYLVQATYSESASAKLVSNPQNRAEEIKPVIEKLGGTLKHLWFAFGEYDAIGIVDLPDNASALAFSLAAAAAGTVTAFKTTPLLTIEEGMQAMKKARDSGYTPPRG